jgi:2-polyprenyl-3-methyl-5-hydroxy-6-metoxy-1,4-benzoquinol methylase
MHPGIRRLRLRCAKCEKPLANYKGNETEISCESCGHKLVYNQRFWDARITLDYPLDFSRQWLLWEAGKLGDTKKIYTNTPEEDFRNVLSTLSISEKDLPALKILEVGFGHGRLLQSLQEFCRNAYGIDLSKPLPSCNFTPGSIVCGSLFNIPLMPRQFDLVICRGVVQCTPDPSLAFRRVAEQVADGGMLYIFIYERQFPRSLVLRRILPFSWRFPESIRLGLAHVLDTAVAAARTVKSKRLSTDTFQQYRGDYILGAFDILSPRWTSFHDPKEVTSWFDEEGFNVKRVSACNYVGMKRRA